VEKSDSWKKPIACHSLRERRCRTSPSYSKRVKVWETETDAEPGEKATGVGSTSFANLYREVAGIVAVNEELGCARGSVKNILQFLGFANSFTNLGRHFVEGFSKVARPPTEPTAFNWAEAARSALATSKHLLPWRYLPCGALKRGSRCFICLFSRSAQERLTLFGFLFGFCWFPLSIERRVCGFPGC
jgi:hypothetical protein